MKKIIILIASIALIFTGCVDRSIIDSKDGVILPTVSNLAYTLTADNVATITWTMPSNIPVEIERPLSVYIQIFKYLPGVLSPTRQDFTTLDGEQVSYVYTLPPEEGEYHVIVKLVGNVSTPVYGESSVIYSLGQSVVLK